MATRIYGTSDDLIEVVGDQTDEFDRYRTVTRLVVSDGTALEICYGKPDVGGVWAIAVLKEGPLFDRLEVCIDEDAEVYSDVAHFKDGVEWVQIVP